MIKEDGDMQKCNPVNNKYFARHQAKIYYNNRSYSIFEIKNSFCFMKHNLNNLILCINLYTLNGQMKILKKVQIQSKIFAFLNQANEFLAFNENNIEQWRLDNMTYKTQTLNNIEKGKRYYRKLSHNDDQLVFTNRSCIQFWIKDKEGNWKQQQIQEINFDIDIIFDAQFNKSGDFLIFTSLEKILFFQKSKIDGDWKQTQISQCHGEQFCFIEEYRFAYLKSILDSMNNLHISTTTLYPDEHQTLSLGKRDVLSQKQSILYIESKNVLFAFCSGYAFFFKQNNDQFEIIRIIELTKHPYVRVTCCKNGNFILIDQYLEFNTGLPPKLLLLKIPSI